MSFTLNPFTGSLDYFVPAGSRDVTGPASATDNAIARWDGTTGTLVQNSTVTISDIGALALSASLTLPYIAKTANYTLDDTNYTVNCTSNTFTITLPTAVGITGRLYNIKNSGTGVITINTTSSQTIDGYASGSITLIQFDNLCVQSDGANWVII